jgi:hypothetical protein
MNAAIAYAKTTMHATNPTIGEAKQDLFDPSHAESKVWVIHLIGDTFQLPPCPPGTPQTTYARTCGSGTEARLGLRISDLTVEYAVVYGGGTPTAQLPIALPPNAKLPTREAAIDAAVQLGDTSGTPPHVVSVDLILAAQAPELQDVPPDTPIWRVSLDHGFFDHSCPALPPGIAPDPCHTSAITVWIEAVTGMWRTANYYEPPGTPAP